MTANHFEIYRPNSPISPSTKAIISDEENKKIITLDEAIRKNKQLHEFALQINSTAQIVIYEITQNESQIGICLLKGRTDPGQWFLATDSTLRKLIQEIQKYLTVSPAMIQPQSSPPTYREQQRNIALNPVPAERPSEATPTDRTVISETQATPSDQEEQKLFKPSQRKNDSVPVQQEKKPLNPHVYEQRLRPVMAELTKAVNSRAKKERSPNTEDHPHVGKLFTDQQKQELCSGYKLNRDRKPPIALQSEERRKYKDQIQRTQIDFENQKDKCDQIRNEKEWLDESCNKLEMFLKEATDKNLPQIRDYLNILKEAEESQSAAPKKHKKESPEFQEESVSTKHKAIQTCDDIQRALQEQTKQYFELSNEKGQLYQKQQRLLKLLEEKLSTTTLGLSWKEDEDKTVRRTISIKK